MKVPPVVTAVGVATGIAIVMPSTPVHAELLVYEPFDYPAGVEMDARPATGLGLSGSYDLGTIQDLYVSTPGLDHGSLPGSVPSVAGNALSDASNGGPGFLSVSLANPVSTAPGEAVYFSALFTFDDSGNGNSFARVSFADDNGDYILLGEPTVGSRGIRIEANTVATGGDTRAEGADGSFIDGHTYWLIGRYFNSATAAGDVLELVGYDTVGSAEIASVFDVDDPAAAFGYTLDALDVDLAQITTLQLEIRGTNNNFLDEIRLGRTYADVAVPEPSTLGLVAAAALGAGSMRRRLRR